MSKCAKTVLSYRQAIELSSVKDIANKIITNNLQATVLQHELPETDLTQGRDTPDKNFIFKSVSLLLLLFSFSFRLYISLFQSNLYLVVDKSFIGSFKPQARKSWFGHRDS